MTAAATLSAQRTWFALRTALKGILPCFALFALSTPTLAAEWTNRAATAFSMQDVIAQFTTAAAVTEAEQQARQRLFADILERFRRTYTVDPTRSLYRVVQEHAQIRNVKLSVDNTLAGTDLRAMNFEIVRLEFDQQDTHVSIFALLSRAGAQHVQPETFIGIDRIEQTRNGTTTTITGMDVVGLLAALYSKKPTPEPPLKDATPPDL